MNKLIFNHNTADYITDNTFIIYLFIISCGIYVITSKNPIVSVLYLILLFSVVACYLIQLTASFIGLSYLLVYVGAVSILFLFILMLINVRISELVTDNNNSIPLSLFIISVFVVIFNISIKLNSRIQTIPLSEKPKEIIFGNYSLSDKVIANNLDELFYAYEKNSDGYDSLISILRDFKIKYLSDSSFSNDSVTTYNDIYNSSSYTWDTSITNMSHINSIGNIIYTAYPMLLLVISVILLLSMIGAIIITVRR